MDRRESIKALLGGAVGTAFLTQTYGCGPAQGAAEGGGDAGAETEGYGIRSDYEARHDARLAERECFTPAELDDLDTLGEIIVPGLATSGWREFVEFISLDLPDTHQTRLRGGLVWLNATASRQYAGRPFAKLDPAERLAIVEGIAWHDPEREEQGPGVRFFDHLRFLAVTCWFTSKPGIQDLGYAGNQPNVWDGPPPEVMARYGVELDPRWANQYADPGRRNETAQWDETGRLLLGDS